VNFALLVCEDLDSMLPSLSMLFAHQEVWVGLLALGAMLAIFWILRGSPPGQSAGIEDDEDALPPGHRDRLIAGVSVGLVLILLGSYLAATWGVIWSVPAFAIGIGLALYLNMASQRYRHASPVLRRTSELSSLFLNGALITGILLVANVAAFRYSGRVIDMTQERTFSLSSLTLNQIGSLKRPITFHLVYGRGARSARQFARVYQLLELYRAANPELIKIENLDPYTEASRTEDLVKRVPDLAVLRGEGVLIEYGERADAQFMVVPAQEMFSPLSPEVASSGADRFETVFKGEDAITSALIRLREANKPKIAFTSGHGESSQTDVNPRSQGIGIWRARLSSVGADVSELNLIRDAIPDDLSLLIIAGPRTPFKAEELIKLKIYADRGGPLLALVSNSEVAGLDEFFKSFNLVIGRGVVFDPSFNYNHYLNLAFAPLKGVQNHAIIEGLQADRAILVPSGAPIHILGQGAKDASGATSSPVNRSLIPIVLLRTSPRSWAETDLSAQRPQYDKGTDESGPLTVGVAVQERPADGSDSRTGGVDPKPRLVLFSSGALANNDAQSIEPTNLDLVMNAASWLRGRPAAIGITPSTHIALTLTADPLLRNRLILVPTLLSTLAIASVGLLVYLARRE
jgi:hypothetical protein